MTKLRSRIATGLTVLALAVLPILTLGGAAAHAGPPPPGTNEPWYQNSNGYQVGEENDGFLYENSLAQGDTDFYIYYVSSGGYGFGAPYWCIASADTTGDNNGRVGTTSSCGEYEEWWLQCGASNTVTIENEAVAYQDGASALNNNQSTYPGAYVTVGSYVSGKGYEIVVGGVGVWLLGGECGY
jgi:hypothetical protein